MADFRSGRRSYLSRVIEETLILKRKPCALCEWKYLVAPCIIQRLQYIKETALRFMASMFGMPGNVYSIKFGCETFWPVPESWHGKSRTCPCSMVSVVIRNLVDNTQQHKQMVDGNIDWRSDKFIIFCAIKIYFVLRYLSLS